MDQLASNKADIVCLSEEFYLANYTSPDFHDEWSETVPGPVTDRVARWASTHNSYVICPIYERRDGKCFNTAVVIDRGGGIVGRYDKIHPTEEELHEGAQCGRVEPVVIETDCGKIGVLICFDVEWPREWSTLKQKGAEIVFWPSAYAGGRALNALAWINSYYIVSAPWVETSDAQVMDICGDVMATSSEWQPWVCTSVNLAKAVFHTDGQIEKVHELEAKYGRAVRVRWYTPEHRFTLEVLGEGLSIDRLQAEFGLITKNDYITRCGHAQDASLGKR